MISVLRPLLLSGAGMAPQLSRITTGLSVVERHRRSVIAVQISLLLIQAFFQWTGFLLRLHTESPDSRTRQKRLMAAVAAGNKDDWPGLLSLSVLVMGVILHPQDRTL